MKELKKRACCRYDATIDFEGALGGLRIFLPAARGYVNYNLVHSVKENRNCDTWRLSQAFAVDERFENAYELTPHGAEWDMAVKLNAQGQIEDIVVDHAAPAGYEASMDIFVISKSYLMEQVREHIARNLFHMDRDLVLGSWNKGLISINVYKFPGLAMFNDSVEEYFSNSLSLLDSRIRHDLFYYNHPVYTKVRDRVPSYYGEDSNIDNCIVADGCMLDGEVSNSVLFRQVTIAEGATVENCLVMNDTVIGEGAYLKNVILDKDVVVRKGAQLMGTASNPVIVGRGEIV